MIENIFFKENKSLNYSFKYTGVP